MLSLSFPVGSLDTFFYDGMKTRKMLVRYITLKNLPFDMVKETDLEDILRQAFHPVLNNFLTILANTCQSDILNIIHLKKNI